MATQPTAPATPLTPSKTPLRRRVPISFAEVTPREIEWLWYPYIPKGAVTMIFGHGGQGKSTLAIEIGAALSSGRKLPGSEAAVSPLRVLILNAEDDPEVSTIERLNASDARLENVLYLPDVFVLDDKGLEELRWVVKEHSIDFVILDPVVEWMGAKRDMNKMNEVREFMGGLKRIAQEFNIGIVVVHHSRKDKGDGGYQQDTAAGSADFTNAVRSSLFVHQVSGQQRIMEHVKTNWGPLGPAWGYTLEGGFKWSEAPAIGHAGPATPNPAPIAKARAFIRDMLKAGPVKQKEIEARYTDEKIASKRTLESAKKGLAESIAVRGPDGKMAWYWRLIGDTRGVGEAPSPEPDPKVEANRAAARKALDLDEIKRLLSNEETV